ncbi:hypothetical protein DL93DRAFT_2163548 [Clavulina sp. PMI_390]|nr:hypothetical protein DL93DRAFT_2163548 [Clavulina sp. PMI_390]
MSIYDGVPNWLDIMSAARLEFLQEMNNSTRSRDSGPHDVISGKPGRQDSEACHEQNALLLASANGAGVNVLQFLPTELLMDALEYLPVRSLVQCMLVSRRFFALVSLLMRRHASRLLHADSRNGDLFNARFEVGLPMDGSYKRRHALTFSRVETCDLELLSESTAGCSQATTTSFPDKPYSHPSSLPTSSSSSSSPASSGEQEVPPSYYSPRATFEFSAEDVPFPIDIEMPFESFRTVLWSLTMARREVKVETKDEGYESESSGAASDAESNTSVGARAARGKGAPLRKSGFTYQYNCTITKGLERIRHSCFGDAPISRPITLSDAPKSGSTHTRTTPCMSYAAAASVLNMTFLPASDVHYKGTSNHGGNPWHPEPQYSSARREVALPESRMDDVDSPEARYWREPCACGARGTFGIKMQKIEIHCGLILKAYEDLIGAEEDRAVKVIML